jgi:hypothetical protein
MATSTANKPGRYARSSATRRPTQGLRRRRQPEPTGLRKLVGAVLPVSAAKKAAPGSKKGRAGGIALAAAAAGVAFKNRDKLSQMTHRDSTAGAPTMPGAANNATAPPADPVG